MEAYVKLLGANRTYKSYRRVFLSFTFSQGVYFSRPPGVFTVSVHHNDSLPLKCFIFSNYHFNIFVITFMQAEKLNCKGRKKQSKDNNVLCCALGLFAANSQE